MLTAFKYSQKVYPTKVDEIKSLNLEPKLSSLISKETYENRMQYELFVESAGSFNDLRQSLEKRGYSHLPMQQFTGYVTPTSINQKSLITNKSTMVRRNSKQ